jgi:hypothetical protein
VAPKKVCVNHCNRRKARQPPKDTRSCCANSLIHADMLIYRDPVIGTLVTIPLTLGDAFSVCSSLHQ